MSVNKYLSHGNWCLFCNGLNSLLKSQTRGLLLAESSHLHGFLNGHMECGGQNFVSVAESRADLWYLPGRLVQ